MISISIPLNFFKIIPIILYVENMLIKNDSNWKGKKNGFS